MLKHFEPIRLLSFAGGSLFELERVFKVQEVSSQPWLLLPRPLSYFSLQHVHSHIFIQGPAEIWDWLFLVSCEHACSLAPVCILPDRQGCVADYPCPLNSPSKFSGCSAGMLLHPVLNPQDNWEIKLFHLFAFEFAIIFSDALGFGCFPYFSLNHISHLQQESFWLSWPSLP